VKNLQLPPTKKITKARIHRETATRAIEGFMMRVNEVNTSPQFTCKVTEVALFGSYLGDKPKLGDMDIAVNLERKDVTGDRPEQAIARATGPASLSWLAATGWPETQVMRHLKNRQPCIGLMDMDEMVEMIHQLTPAKFKFDMLLGDRNAILERSKLSMFEHAQQKMNSIKWNL
jgi:hypothetical protein